MPWRGNIVIGVLYRHGNGNGGSVIAVLVNRRHGHDGDNVLSRGMYTGISIAIWHQSAHQRARMFNGAIRRQHLCIKR